MKVLFIFNDFPLHNHIIENYCNLSAEHQVAIVKVPLVLKGKSRSDSANKIFPQLSKRFIWSKLKEFITVAFITLLPKIFNKGLNFKKLKAIAKLKKLEFHLSKDVMSKETIGFIKEQEPDIIVTLFHQIIKEDLIKVPRLGVLNIHPGILPNFRGIQPYFWELMENFGEGGASFHFIEDSTIDTGSLVAQTRFNTSKGMSVQLNYFLTTKSASNILPEVINLINEEKILPREQDSKIGKYYRWPDSKSVDQLIKQGHPIISLKDLLGILLGKYDDFKSKFHIFYKS